MQPAASLQQQKSDMSALLTSCSWPLPVTFFRVSLTLQAEHERDRGKKTENVQ
jgi:hypothetical protein